MQAKIKILQIKYKDIFAKSGTLKQTPFPLLKKKRNNTIFIFSFQLIFQRPLRYQKLETPCIFQIKHPERGAQKNLIPWNKSNGRNSGIHHRLPKYTYAM